jgi:NAD(P)-dependent dehydrogenase (short-subunit alcohol dehydrogenase family)
VSDDDQPHRHLRLVHSKVPGADGAPPAPPPAATYQRGSFHNLFDLTGKVALVVGGGGGIGGAIAHALADHGARIVIADQKVDAARHVAQSCARPNVGGALAVQLDVTNPELVNQVVRAVEGETERIDILVNSAGINIRRPVVDYTPDEWMRIINVNLSGLFYVTQAVARGMLERGYGRILNLGSVSSLMGHPHHAPYAATKGGIAIMTKAMATEWAAAGITVNAIGPAYTETGLIADYVADPATRDEILSTIPMRRFGKPEDIAGAAVYLCSDAAGFVTGQTLYVDGGRTAD